MAGSTTARKPHAGAVEVLWCDLSARDGEAAAFAAELGPDERARAARFRLPRDRDRFILRRAWRRRRVGEALGLPPSEVRFDEAPGRPRVLGSGLELSTASSSGVAVLALRLAQPLGVDLEKHDPALMAELMKDGAGVFTSPAALLDLDDAARLAAWFDRWTEVEARSKLRGDGLPGFDASEPVRAGEHLTRLSVLPGFSAALATAARPDDVQIRRAPL